MNFKNPFSKITLNKICSDGMLINKVESFFIRYITNTNQNGNVVIFMIMDNANNSEDVKILGKHHLDDRDLTDPNSSFLKALHSIGYDIIKKEI